MRKFVFTVAAMSGLAVGALGQAAGAAAVPTGGGTAAETVMALMDQGYTVQLNGVAYGPLSKCWVKDVHGLSGTATRPGHFDTVYVDIACPSSNN